MRQAMTSREPRSPKPAKSQNAVRLGPEIRARIGRQLRAMYDDVVNQGVPDRFSELLKNLEVPQAKEEK
jgi:hypothetical protein